MFAQVGLNFPQGLEDVVNHCFLPRKQYVWSSGVQVAEGRLVERRFLYNAPRRKLIDDQLDEANLLRRQALVGEKTRERGSRNSLTFFSYWAPVIFSM